MDIVVKFDYGTDVLLPRQVRLSECDSVVQTGWAGIWHVDMTKFNSLLSDGLRPMCFGPGIQSVLYEVTVNDFAKWGLGYSAGMHSSATWTSRRRELRLSSDIELSAVRALPHEGQVDYLKRALHTAASESTKNPPPPSVFDAKAFLSALDELLEQVSPQSVASEYADE